MCNYISYLMSITNIIPKRNKVILIQNLEGLQIKESVVCWLIGNW